MGGCLGSGWGRGADGKCTAVETFTGKIWQTFGGSLNFSLGCSGGVVGEGHQCRQLRQGPRRRPGWAGVVTYFRSLPDAPSVTVDADPEIVGSSAELGAAGMQNWSGDLTELFISVFRRETIGRNTTR